MSQIVWTALPRRIKDGNLELSVLVSPRLDVTTLVGSSFANWPETLQAITQIPIALSGFALMATVTNAPFDAALWKEMFANTKVKPFKFSDNSQRPIWSFKADTLMEEIDAMYHQVAQASPNEPPLLDMTSGSDPLVTRLFDWSEANRARIELKQSEYENPADWTQASLAERTHMLGPKMGNRHSQPLTASQLNAYRARRFFDRPSPRRDAKGYLKQAPVVAIPEFEFHEKIALLSDHPYLLRRLGLILDLVVPMSRDLPTSGRVMVTPPGGRVEEDVLPRTAYVIQGNRFLPAPKPASTEARDGMLPLDNGHYALLQGEVNGDAHKVINFASNMVRLTDDLDEDSHRAGLGPHAPPTRQGLPARRTTGFLVTRKDREAAIKQRFVESAAHNDKIEQNGALDLYAEDVTRGYRVDVLTHGTWASLHRRRVRYAFGQPGSARLVAEDVRDEGYVKAASGTSDPDPSGPRDLYIHESLFGWEGWSLAAPRPGRVIADDYSTDQTALNPPSRTALPDFQIDARSTVEPGSLPKLRFGATYQLRARLVDLAGSSLEYDSPDALALSHATSTQRYKRYEPISPPVLVPRHVVTEGESLEHLVVRSGDALYGKNMVDPDAYAIALNTLYDDPAFPKKYKGYCDRHIAPPKNTQERAELHGVFDGAFLAGADRRKYYRLATREEGTFADKRIVDLDVDDGYIDGNPNGAMIVTPPQVPLDRRRKADGAANISSLMEHRGDALAPGEYIVCDVDQVLCPYLPDVPAAGVAFFDENNHDVFPLSQTTWKGHWPDLGCFRLRLVGAASDGVDGSNPHEKVIMLAPGTMKTIRFASTPNPVYLDHLKYWLDHSQAPDVVQGRHWMLTPAREIKLVHAVQRPIVAPEAYIKLSRKEDETFVTHEGVMTFHGESTGHVDVVASWFEYEDRLTRPLPNDIIGDPNRGATPQSGHAYQIGVDYGEKSVGIPALHHELGDTKHRVVKYTPVATTRYKEYFPAKLIANPDNLVRRGDAKGPLVGDQWSIPSSARPMAPKVVYVVPTFKWEPSTDGKKSVRRGGGLRVYLDRPWYSSGEGEQIAVITAQSQRLFEPGDAVLALVSRWGRDPIWNSKANGPLQASTFTNAKGIVSGLALSEDPTAPVDAVIYDVEYSPERKLWFFDIEMDPGQAYFPFVSLMLARFQKESLVGLELSACVRAEFAQVVPDRTLTVTFTPTLCAVSVKGVVAENSWGAESPYQPAPPPTRAGQPPAAATPLSHKFVAYLQERSPGSVGDLGWNRVTGETDLGGQMPVGSLSGQWSGVVMIPNQQVRGMERRLVVEEREIYSADETYGQNGDVVYAMNTAYRVVYVDMMTVPGVFTQTSLDVIKG